MSKSSGKTLLSLAGIFFGGGAKLFGTAAGAGIAGGGLAGALYGMSLASTIWSALHPPKSTYNFDATQNVVGEDSMIPVVYGTRKFGGVQTNSYTNASATTQSKDIVFSEGTISGVSGVTANCLLINTGAIFSLANNVHSDATVTIYETGHPTGNDKLLVLYAGGTTVNIALQASCDIATDQSNDFSCSTLKLQDHIEKLGNGWVITNCAGVDDSPEDIYDIATTNCYGNPVDFIMGGLSDSSYELHDGNPSQTPPSNYATTGSYKNCAWLRSNLKVSSRLQGSNPTISAIVKGKLVYDPRTGITAYSENPALCLRDYLLSKRYGMGRWISEDAIDTESFNEVADYCDGLVSYKDGYGNTVTEKRYRLNIILAEKRKNIDNIQAILAVFAGFLVFSGDKLSLRVEKQESTSYTFDETNIKANSVKFEQTDLESSPNRYCITYYDPAQNWVGVKCIVEDTADQHQRGNVISKDVQLQGCIHQGQALRLGRVYNALNRMCPNVVTFSTGTMAMHLQPGDIIKFNYRVITDLPMRILQISQNKGVWSIKAQQYNQSIYDDALGAQISIGNYVQVSNPFIDTVPTVTNLTIIEDSYVATTDGSVFTNVNVVYTPASYAFLREYEVYYDVNQSGIWKYYGKTLDTGIVLRSLNDVVGKSVRVGVVTGNSIGRKSNMVISNTVTLIGKSDSPPDIVNFAVGESNGALYFTWTMPAILDLDYVEIREGSEWGSSTLIAKVTSSDKYSTTMYTNGTKNYIVKAMDNSGNPSVNATNYSLTTSGSPYKKLLQNIDITMNKSLPGWYMDDTTIYMDNPMLYMEQVTAISGYIMIDNVIDLGEILSSTIVISEYITTTGNATATIEISTSFDGIAYSEWKVYVASTYTCRYINLRVYLESTDSSNVTVQSLSIDIMEFTQLATMDDLSNISVGAQYLYTQVVPSDTWVIVHGLGKYPAVRVVDNEEDSVVGDVVPNSLNQITIYFSQPISGMAYCS